MLTRRYATPPRLAYVTLLLIFIRHADADARRRLCHYHLFIDTVITPDVFQPLVAACRLIVYARYATLR